MSAGLFEDRGRRAIASSLFVFEAVTVLLAIPVARVVGGPPTPVWAAVCGLLALALFAAPGVLRRPGAVAVGWTLQIAVFGTGLAVWPMFVVGVVFGATWLLVLRLRGPDA